MNLCVKPKIVQMVHGNVCNSSDWVMVPNVYGMGLFSDGEFLQPNHTFVDQVIYENDGF